MVSWRLLELWSRIQDLQGLEECGRPIGFQLKTVCSNLLGLHREDGSVSDADQLTNEAFLTSEALLILADEKLSSYVYRDVPTCWRQLYTDSTLIKVSSIFARQVVSPTPSDAVDWREMVRLLDMALIIAGAPGKGRKSVVFYLIAEIQATYLNSDFITDEPANRPMKRARRAPKDAAGGPPIPLPRVLNPIVTFDSQPSAEEFARTLHEAPFIIKGYCQGWKALTTRPWRDLDYLKSAAGPARVVPIEVGKSYADEDWSQSIVRWDDFLDRLERSEPGRLNYLAQYDIFNQFPSLRDDITLPDYVYCHVPPATRQVPQVEDGVILNAWLGPAGTVSPAHVDPYYNCYAQIVGRKYIWVAPPSFCSEMYPFGASSDEHQEQPTIQSSYMTNTSQVDVLASCETDELEELRHRFPEFVKKVMPQASQIVLEAGDMMVMPPGWWHSMKSLETSINVSMWF